MTQVSYMKGYPNQEGVTNILQKYYEKKFVEIIDKWWSRCYFHVSLARVFLFNFWYAFNIVSFRDRLLSYLPSLLLTLSLPILSLEFSLRNPLTANWLFEGI